MFKKTKKGISPLIATVIIIGFTIVLAAVVITFGTNFLKGLTASTEKSSAISQLCTTGLSGLDLKVTKNGVNYNVVLDNKNNVKIEGLVMRAYQSPTVVGTITSTLAQTVPVVASQALDTYVVDKFSVKTFSVAAPAGVTPKEVGILPKVKVKDTDPQAETCNNELKVSIVGA